MIQLRAFKIDFKGKGHFLVHKERLGSRKVLFHYFEIEDQFFGVDQGSPVNEKKAEKQK
jgi:hypothetical protein